MKRKNKNLLKTRKEYGIPVVFMTPKQILIWEGHCRCGNIIELRLYDIKGKLEDLNQVCDSCNRTLALIVNDDF